MELRGQVMTVRSNALRGEQVLFAGDDVALAAHGQPPVTYRWSELREIEQLRPSRSLLATVHEVKRAFGPQATIAPPHGLEFRPSRLWTREQVEAAWRGWTRRQQHEYEQQRQRALGVTGDRVYAASFAAEWVAK